MNKIAKLKVSIDASRCASSGNCADLAPGIFTQDDNTGIVILLVESPSPAQYEAVRNAERLCPAQAITVIEEKE
ncbi:MAG TPA: ferredoxin [Ramlibacter sp.]|nr:ferredoxin [Ramlibacter sp.]